MAEEFDNFIEQFRESIEDHMVLIMLGDYHARGPEHAQSLQVAVERFKQMVAAVEDPEDRDELFSKFIYLFIFDIIFLTFFSFFRGHSLCDESLRSVQPIWSQPAARSR